MSRDTGSDDAAVGTRDDDDDAGAFTWGESSDKSYVEGPASGGEGAAGSGDRAAGGSDDTEGSGESDGSGDSDDELEAEVEELPDGVLDSTMLVVHGIFGGLYLLVTVAWLRSVGSVQPSLSSPVADGMWRIGTWLAVAGPAIWFVGTLLLTKTSASRARVISFAVGFVVLLPWPFFIGAWK